MHRTLLISYMTFLISESFIQVALLALLLYLCVTELLAVALVPIKQVRVYIPVKANSHNENLWIC